MWSTTGSLESERWQNGAFTKIVVEGLRGGADLLHSGRITVNMLDAYVSEGVKHLTGGQQVPMTNKAAEDFPLALGMSSQLPASKPIYKRWWFWTAIGVVAAGTVAGIVAGTTISAGPDFPARVPEGARGDVHF